MNNRSNAIQFAGNKYQHYILTAWLLAIAIVAVAGFALRPESATSTSDRLFKSISKETVKDIRNLLAPSTTVLLECVANARTGHLPLLNENELGLFLANRLRFEKGLKWLSYSDNETGRFTGARREGTEIILNRSDPLVNDGRPFESTVHDDGSLTPIAKVLPPGYDPRKGEWYKAAFAGKGIVWTKPFKFNEGVLGITAATAYRQTESGRAQGVFTADFYLVEIANFLNGLTDGNQNYLFLLDRNGDEITEPLSQPREKSAELLALMGSQIPAFATLEDSQPRQAAIELNGQRYETRIEFFQASENLEWACVIIAPESYLLGPDAVSKAAWSARLRLAALLLAVSFVVYLAFTLFRASLRPNAEDPAPSSKSTERKNTSTHIPPLPVLTVDTSLFRGEIRSRLESYDKPAGESIKLESLISKGQLSVKMADLTMDRLLAMTPRMNIDGRPVPALAGIPLLAKLGQGGMGAVYYGLHPRLKKEVAVKVLSFVLANSEPEYVARFHREGQMAAQIQSPFLVNVFDAGEEKGLFYLVMEYVCGTSAGQFLEDTQTSGAPALSESIALEICVAATRGLVAAHTQGIVHRDIKPDNIMLPRAGDGNLEFRAAKLTDLGLARVEGASSLTISQTIMGSVGFMAPEQARDFKRAGKCADIFSMGATLYTLIGGNTPFEGATAFDTLMHTLDKPHKSLRELQPNASPEIAAVVDKCLAKDPDDRYPDAAALFAALVQCRSKGKEAEKPAVPGSR